MLSGQSALDLPLSQRTRKEKAPRSGQVLSFHFAGKAHLVTITEFSHILKG